MVFSASAAFAAGLQTQSLIILNDESYVPARWQGMMFYWAVVFYSAILNIWGPRVLPHLNIVSGGSIPRSLCRVKVTNGTIRHYTCGRLHCDTCRSLGDGSQEHGFVRIYGIHQQ